MNYHIVRESDGPVVVRQNEASAYSGSYNMTAVSPSNTTTDWTFYSSLYLSGIYSPSIDTNHGSVSSNQYGRAKKNLLFEYSASALTPTSGMVVKIWASGGNDLTYVDTLEYITIPWSGIAPSLGYYVEDGVDNDKHYLKYDDAINPFGILDVNDSIMLSKNGTVYDFNVLGRAVELEDGVTWGLPLGSGSIPLKSALPISTWRQGSDDIEADYGGILTSYNVVETSAISVTTPQWGSGNLTDVETVDSGWSVYSGVLSSRTRDIYYTYRPSGHLNDHLFILKNEDLGGVERLSSGFIYGIRHYHLYEQQSPPYNQYDVSTSWYFNDKTAFNQVFNIGYYDGRPEDPWTPDNRFIGLDYYGVGEELWNTWGEDTDNIQIVSYGSIVSGVFI